MVLVDAPSAALLAEIGFPPPHSTPTTPVPREIPLEAAEVESYEAHRAEEAAVALRVEAQLVREYVAWLSAQGHDSTRHQVTLPEGRSLYSDVFDTDAGELIEAKASAKRVQVRAGLGQIRDDARFVAHHRLALLLPDRPVEDLVDLLREHGVGVIWRAGDDFH